MIDTDKYEGHTKGLWRWKKDYYDGSCFGEIMPEKSELNKICRVYAITEPNENETMVHNSEYDIVNMKTTNANRQLLADAPLLLEFIQKIVKDWCKPNQCNKAFGKDVRQLMYEYGLITFNEETRRYEVKE
jgi:hypothetical protein